MLSIEVATLGNIVRQQIPSVTNLYCFSCCLKMHGQVERKLWLHLLLARVHVETLGGSGPIFCSSDVDHFDFFLLLCCSAISPLI